MNMYMLQLTSPQRGTKTPLKPKPVFICIISLREMQETNTVLQFTKLIWKRSSLHDLDFSESQYWGQHKEQTMLSVFTL